MTRSAVDGERLRETTLKVLRGAQCEMNGAGVRHASIFGSVARAEARDHSDVDILVELDPEAHVGLFEFGQLQSRLQEILTRKVDLVSRGGLAPERHSDILAEAIVAF